MKLFVKTFALLAVISLYTTRMFGQECHAWTENQAAEWFAKGEYLGGLNIKPHDATNKIEFAIQYTKNKARWDKAFAFLKNTNLDTIRVGKYPIDGTEVFASVTENPTKAYENTKLEFHKKYIDIQYVIKGKEKMGVASASSITINTPYDEKKDVGFGESTTEVQHLAEPGKFLLFFPTDAHRPNIKAEGCDVDKKIVIKVLVD